MSKELNTALANDLDALLDATLDDISDLPENKAFPEGSHQVDLMLSYKKIKDVLAMEVNLTYIDVLELANPSDVPPAPGDTTSILYQMDSPFGQGQFKPIASALMAHFNVTNLRGVLEQLALGAVQCAVTTKKRIDKNDKTKAFTKVVTVAVL